MLLKEDASDEMAFVLRSEDADPEHSFSREGVQAITDQIHDFLMARTSGTWRKTGQAPKEMRAIVKLDWIGPEDEWLDQGPRPWFALDDKGATPFDGEARQAGVEGVKKMGRQR